MTGATLNRFFTLHSLLPFVIFGLVVLQNCALHVAGQNNPTGLDVKSKSETVPMSPYAISKDLFAMVVFLIVFAWFVFFLPDYLGHADNSIPANPLVTPAHIVPEWYFLPFYAILRAVPSKLGGVVLMFAAVGILAFLPWLDTSRVRSARYRPYFKWFFWLFVVSCLALGYLGAKPAEGKEVGSGMYWNDYYPGHQIAMAPPLVADSGLYNDGTPETVEQYAKDVSAFLVWAGDPTLNQRKSTGWVAVLFLIITSLLLYVSKRRIWSDVH